MERLTKLHDEVKNHVFRESSDRDHVDDYLDKLTKLMNCFLDEAKNLHHYSDIKWSLISFSHDFKSCLLQIRWDKEDAKDVQHIEQCISCIHKFIEYEYVVEIWTYYTGVNKYDSSKRMRQYLWHPDKEKLIPQYETEELKNVIQEIEEFRKEHDNDTSDLITSMYDEDRLQFYRNLLITGNHLMHKIPRYQY